MKLGTAVAKAIHPIAVASDTVLGTDLQNCSKCKKREQSLNDWSDSAWDFLWNNNNNEPENKHD